MLLPIPPFVAPQPRPLVAVSRGGDDELDEGAAEGGVEGEEEGREGEESRQDDGAEFVPGTTSDEG